MRLGGRQRSGGQGKKKLSSFFPWCLVQSMGKLSLSKEVW